MVALKRRDHEHLILSNHEVGLRPVRLLSERLHEAETCLAELSHKEVPARLASQILRLIESEGSERGKGYEIPTRYTHEQLAMIIGSKRVPVSWAFSTLKAEGAIEVRDRQIHVVNLEALKRAAEA